MAMRVWVTAALILAAALASAPAALARTTNSSNWAGYAVHRPGVSFREVSGTWTQPDVACVAGQPTYSAVWVGLGGYKPTSDALEQIGTEADCGAGGNVVSNAWFELVPAPSKTISLVVHPGDLMHATVTVVGHQVTVELENLTRHRAFHKTLFAPAIDVGSAEWIVEAPSECISQFACQSLPLADFGSVTFASASASSALGTSGSIVDPTWWRTKIKLTPGSQRFIVARRTSGTAGMATPSTLRSEGSEFDVTYSTTTVPPNQFDGTRQSRLRAAYLEH
jgi:Peptidase A4 family